MEIEAKFGLPNSITLTKLQSVGQLAGFRVDPPRTSEVHDTYLDTDQQSILAAGHFCRRRVIDGQTIITVKSVGPSLDAIHRREELEIVVPSRSAPAKWPESPARTLILQIIGDQKLKPLFSLWQSRSARAICRNDICIAKLSLDRVRVRAGKKRLSFLEVEAELDQGTGILPVRFTRSGRRVPTEFPWSTRRASPQEWGIC